MTLLDAFIGGPVRFSTNVSSLVLPFCGGTEYSIMVRAVYPEALAPLAFIRLYMNNIRRGVTGATPTRWVGYFANILAVHFSGTAYGLVQNWPNTIIVLVTGEHGLAFLLVWTTGTSV